MDIVKFLRARLDEDEQRARLALETIGGRWDSWEVVSQQLHACCDTVPRIGRAGQHLQYNADPDRVLREVDAKRRIVEVHDPWTADNGDVICFVCGREHVADRPGGHFPCTTLRLLALPYADHPDYREDWRP